MSIIKVHPTLPPFISSFVRLGFVLCFKKAEGKGEGLGAFIGLPLANLAIVYFNFRV